VPPRAFLAARAWRSEVGGIVVEGRGFGAAAIEVGGIIVEGGGFGVTGKEIGFLGESLWRSVAAEQLAVEHHSFRVSGASVDAAGSVGTLCGSRCRGFGLRGRGLVRWRDSAFALRSSCRFPWRSSRLPWRSRTATFGPSVLGVVDRSYDAGGDITGLKEGDCIRGRMRGQIFGAFAPVGGRRVGIQNGVARERCFQSRGELLSIADHVDELRFGNFCHRVVS
jgi:hypothetical protein